MPSGNIRVRIARFDDQRNRWRPVLNAPFASLGRQRLLIFATEDGSRGGSIIPVIIAEALPAL